ncbi:MAG: hypothetical protein HZB37_08755 [Planctomycetes bacterium]|nr:hypothetical protein [Planctomycetota bacterium]
MSETKKSIDEYFRDGTEIDKAIQQAVKAALLRHKAAGKPIVSWKDGDIAWIQAEDIQIPN